MVQVDVVCFLFTIYSIYFLLYIKLQFNISRVKYVKLISLILNFRLIYAFTVINTLFSKLYDFEKNNNISLHIFFSLLVPLLTSLLTALYQTVSNWFNYIWLLWKELWCRSFINFSFLQLKFNNNCLQFIPWKYHCK